MKFILLLLFISPSYSIAQDSTISINGRVIQKYSKTGIPNASIEFLKNFGVLTDSLGQFKIESIPRKPILLKFSAISYSPVDTLLTFENWTGEQFIWEINIICKEFTEQRAIADLSENKIIFVLQGSIAPTVTKSQIRLSKKFGVKFYELGCTFIENFECLSRYNQTVASFLDQKFGLQWRKNLDAKIYGVTK